LKSLLCMSHSARSSPFRLSFMYRWDWKKYIFLTWKQHFVN
jgi:hypothetical protein